MPNIRQYIGARYVFKIYENSVDPSSAEWESNTSYEPLTIVTYQNTTYASKKDVPASIGNPAVNPIYWVVTGAYNGQIATLQSEIDTINNVTIPAIDARMNAIDGEISDLQKLSRKNVVWIGDSYGDEATEHPNIINGIVGFKSFYNLSTGSTGFTGKEGSASQSVDLEWRTILKNWVDQQTPETLASIDDVYISGGFNDVYATDVPTIRTYISTFMGYAKAVLPNADFHLCFCGWAAGAGTVTTPTETALAANFRFRLANKVMIAYSQCNTFGMEYMGNALNALHNYDLCFGADKYHPNATGQERLARQILNYMLGGGAIPYTNFIDGNPKQPFTLETLDGVSPYHTLFDSVSYDNDTIIFKNSIMSPQVGGSIPYTADANIPARTPTTIGNWKSVYLAPVMDGVARTYYTIPVFIQTADDCNVADLIMYPGGTLQLYTYTPISSGTSFYIIMRGALALKIWDC